MSESHYCEEHGWNSLNDRGPCPYCLERDGEQAAENAALSARVRELEDAIRLHRDGHGYRFPSQLDHKLWELVP